MTSASPGMDLASLGCAALMGGIIIFLLLVVAGKHYGITARFSVAMSRLFGWLAAVAVLIVVLLALVQEVTGIPVLNDTMSNLSDK